MAQVVDRRPNTAALDRRSLIERELEYQVQAWQRIPEQAAWWPQMEAIDREVFHLEWVGITEGRLHELQQWAEQGRLTPPQRARYDSLMRLVAEHRPIVQQLLES